MRKIIIFLIILLIIQIGLTVFQYRPGRNDSRPVAELLPDIRAEEIKAFTVEGPEDKKVKLSKDEKGNWQVAGAEKELYPADQQKTKDMLQRLTTLKSKRLVTRTSASHARLKVDDRIFAKKITLDTGEGGGSVLYIGSSTGSETLHARRRGSDKAYLVSGISSWELGISADSWWQRDYLELSEKKAKSITLSNSKGDLTLIKEENWRLAGESNGTELDSGQVSDFIKKLDQLKIKKYLPRKDINHVLDNPEAVLSVDYEDRTLTLKAAPLETEKDTYVLKSSWSPFYVTMSSYALEPLLEQEPAAFRKHGQGSGENSPTLN
ncbi:MAG: DUF4340 domain-containing protein [Thermodesulfobacteriota bacterium]